MVSSVQSDAGARLDAGAETPLRLWGLSADELHRAYWRARGIQVIERGRGEKSDAAAELYLLVEPDQWVIFPQRDIISKMTWNGAEAVYVRVIQEEERRYRERVVLDQHGSVECIERFYRPNPHSSYRVVLTRSRRLAEAWRKSADRRAGWRELQHLLPFYQVDHGRCAGSCFDAGSREEAARLLDTLASNWKDPHRAIDGIEEIAPDVWAPAMSRNRNVQVLVGPAWVGEGAIGTDDVLIGPCWRGDHPGIATNGLSARLRSISEIEPPQEAGQESAASPPRRDGFFTLKRGFDVAVSAAVLLLTLPVFLLIGAAILVDDGRPIFFGHDRQTKGGRVFKCWKFRTMRRDADVIKARLAELNVCDGPQFFIENDPRVTRVGRLLRKFHLDELPQFYNVLVGQMSIVGPRPSPDDENQYCPAWRELRLSVRPGITGLWQIQRTRAPGRDFQEWIRYDIEYVRRAGFWLDLRICARTIWNIVGRRHHRAPYEAR
jgi:lipopolysaccharide/colanic/teichoic acid biosynthesis glycosyltransferase